MFTKKRIVLLILIAILIIAVPIMAAAAKVDSGNTKADMQVLTLWQIDGFEGGKGSRTQYLADKADKLFEGKSVYLNVVSLSSTAAKKNIDSGILPDMISCAPTFNAHLKYINTKDFVIKTWCYGSYCILTLGENAQFDDVNAQNTVINSGKENLAKAAAVLCGLQDAQMENSTNAYLQLLNGKYKYLFGTQRDVYRLKTREQVFSVVQVTQFNDLYQNISILTRDTKRYETCRDFAEYIELNCSDVDKIGMLSDKSSYTDEMAQLKKVEYEYFVKYPCNDLHLSQITDAAINNDVNAIKNLIK